MVQRRGGTTYLEFRTWQGTLRARAFPFHYRTLLDPTASSPRSSGPAAPSCTARMGTGLAPFEGEDPQNLSTRSEVVMNRSDRHQVRKRLGPVSMYRRVVELEQEIQESRRLNQRLSDLIDVVTEVLVPAVDRDDERLRAALARLDAKVAPPTAGGSQPLTRVAATGVRNTKTRATATVSRHPPRALKDGAMTSIGPGRPASRRRAAGARRQRVRVGAAHHDRRPGRPPRLPDRRHRGPADRGQRGQRDGAARRGRPTPTSPASSSCARARSRSASGCRVDAAGRPASTTASRGRS